MWDIHIEEQYQRKGLGKHLLMILELIAKNVNMTMVCIPVQLEDDDTLGWVTNGARGYAPDLSLKDLVNFDAEMEGFQVYAKPIGASSYAATSPIKQATSNPAMITPTKPKKIEIQVESPQGVADAIPEPEVDDDAEGSVDDRDQEATYDVSIEDIDEHDIINGLKVMFREKNNRDASEEECQKWLDEIRSSKTETSSPPPAPTEADEESAKNVQAKIDKRTYNC
jgi:hypothetical protein